jgi:hypothetical protein
MDGLGSLSMDLEAARRRREHDKIRELKRMVKLGGKGGKGMGWGGRAQSPEAGRFRT